MEDTEEDFAELSVTLKYLLAGGIAGAASRTLVAPLERAKIVYQVHYHGKDKKVPTSLFKFLVDSQQKAGLKSLFRGNAANILKIVPYSAVQYASYEYLKKLFCRDEEENHLYIFKRLCAGAFAGMVAATVIYPLDLIRTRLSADLSSSSSSSSSSIEQQHRRYKGIIDCAKKCFNTDSMLDMKSKEARIGSFSKIFIFYKGLTPTLMGIGPYVGLNFACFESLKIFYANYNEIQYDGFDQVSVIPRLICGGTAGALSQTVTYPLDLMRHRLQMSYCQDTSLKYSSSLSLMKDIYKNEGIAGFYKGMTANLLKVAPSIGISFVTYEFCVKHLLAS